MQNRLLSLSALSLVALVGLGTMSMAARNFSVHVPQDAAAEDEAADDSADLSDLAPEVQNAIKKDLSMFLGPIPDKAVIMTTEGGTAKILVKMPHEGREFMAGFTGEGEIVFLYAEASAEEIPPAAVAAIKSRYPEGTVSGGAAMMRVSYLVQVVVDGKPRLVEVDAFGRSVSTSGGDALPGAESDGKKPTADKPTKEEPAGEEEEEEDGGMSGHEEPADVPETPGVRSL